LTGIGVENQSVATLLRNKCLENGMVAIGVRHGATAHILENELVRTDGMPPMIAVRENSTAVIRENIIRGGGVAGVMVQGTATISSNKFEGNGPRGGGPPNYAVWVQEGSEVVIADNTSDRWRHAVFANSAKKISITDNRASQFLKTAIVVQKTESPAHVTGNIAVSDTATDQAVSITGPTGIVTDNEVRAVTASK
jgi:nitrous oxidase accessory protein NosD